MGVNTYAQASVSVSAVVASPEATTLQVDAVRVSWCYTLSQALSGASTGISWKYLAFSPNRQLWALRSSGQVDEVEWNCSTLQYISGANRDGGYAMPDGYWQSGRLRGANRRLTRVGVDRNAPSESVQLTAYCDVLPSGLGSSAPSGLRYAEFPSTVQGFEHRIQVGVPESSSGVTGLELVFNTLSQGIRRI
jgi:hypothetical protein